MLKKILFISTQLFCSLSGISQILFQESFDNKIFPPVGWSNRRTVPSVSSTDNLWERVSISNNPVIATHSGAGMAFFNSYSFAVGTKTELATPSLDFSTGGSFTVKFWMYRDGNPVFNNDEIDIYVNTSQSAGGTLLATIARSYQNSPTVPAIGWYQYSYTIPPIYNGNSNYIIFRASSATGNNMTIDDIEIFGPQAVTCYYPTNLSLSILSTTTAAINWSAPFAGIPDSYDWEIRTSGNPGSGAGGLVSSGNIAGLGTEIPGLTANTNYAFYVRSSCGAAKSIWTAVLNFKTACSLNAIPFAENFDGVVAPNLPNCFIVENRNSGNTWTNTNLGASSFSPYSSPNALVFASQTSIAGDDWVYTGALSLTAGVNYRTQFLYKALFSGFSNSIEIKFGKAPVATAMNSGIVYSINAISNTGFQQANFSFIVPESGVYYLGIHNITPVGAFNYQMLLDNIFIDIGPDANCGTVSNVVTDIVGLNNASISWTAPAFGTPVTYDWELRTSGLPGSGATGLFTSGNISAATSINLTVLSMGTTYRFYLKTNCISPSYGVWNSGLLFTTFTTACGAVTGLTYSGIVKDGFRANWNAPGISSPPIGYDWEVRTSGSGGSGNIGLISSGTTTNLFVDISGLTPATFYGFYVRVRCASGNNSAWIFSPSGVTTAVVNDLCADALNLIVGNGFCTNPEVTQLDLAYPSQNLSSSCALLSNGSGTFNSLKDAWYKITIPASGNAIVQTHTVLISTVANFYSNNNNNMLIAYTGTCGNLTEIACDLDGAPDDKWGLSAYQSKIALTGRTPGEVIYIRLLPDARNSPFINFTTTRAGIGAWDTSAIAQPAVSDGGNCIISPSLDFNSIVNTNNYFRWNPIFDNSGKIIAELWPNAPTGTTSISTYVNPTGSVRNTPSGKTLLDRNLRFSSQSQPTNYSAFLRLYYKKQELEKLKLFDPAVEYDFLDIISTNSLCNGGVFSGTETNIIPKAFGRYGDDYYVEMELTSLTNFFFSGSSTISKICTGGNTTFVSDLSGSSYQWQVDNGTGFTNISNNSNYTGASSNTLQINNTPPGWYGYQYRCLVNSNSYSRKYKIQFTNTWTGIVNDKWENPANWSCGIVPDQNMDVIVNSGNIIIESATAICRSLQTKPGVFLTVISGNHLTIIH